MKLDDWTKIAELTSAVAVVVTLVLLVLEIQDNTAAIRASRTQEAYVLMLEARRDIQNGPIAGVLAKLEAEETLSPEEAMRYRGYVVLNLNAFEVVYLDIVEGRLDEATRIALESRMESGILGFVGFAETWDGRRQYYSERFQRFVDKVLAKASPEDASAAEPSEETL